MRRLLEQFPRFRFSYSYFSSLKRNARKCCLVQQIPNSGENQKYNRWSSIIVDRLRNLAQDGLATSWLDDLATSRWFVMYHSSTILISLIKISKDVLFMWLLTCNRYRFFHVKILISPVAVAIETTTDQTESITVIYLLIASWHWYYYQPLRRLCGIRLSVSFPFSQHEEELALKAKEEEERRAKEEEERKLRVERGLEIDEEPEMSEHGGWLLKGSPSQCRKVGVAFEMVPLPTEEGGWLLKGSPSQLRKAGGFWKGPLANWGRRVAFERVP